MRRDATTSSGDTMSCERVARDEILESYLLARLSEEERTAFEAHYFECARCFHDLQTVQAVQRELQRAGGGALEPKKPRPVIVWIAVAGLAAVVLLAVAAALWMRTPPSPNVSERTVGRGSSPPAETAAGHSARPEATPAPPPSLEQLARVDPPPFEPLTLRGVGDEATVRFDRGMKRYRNAEYRAAISDLRAAAALDPDAPHIAFFLGICHLMLGHDDAAIDRLRATIALGDSPYLDEAHFYLAKAFLRRQDLGAAGRELKTVVRLRGSWRNEARQLLTNIERLTQPPPP